ncbi:MAG: protoporphyrinogen oxidase [Planctomycetes bacterium]|nr:protoporphyrinogen oxidase [Planctomycetota bacterium]
MIGGGISGLAAAYHLGERHPAVQVTLFEASPRLGGVLQTDRRDGYLLERSADNFITNVPWARDLCERLGLGNELIGTSAVDRRVYVVHRGKLRAIPEGFMLLAPQRLWPIITTPVLSLPGKLRMLAEAFVPRRSSDDDESLQAFAVRRLGKEAFEQLVQPLVGGIYTADSSKLSLAATLPRFIEMEQQHGSLIRAALKQRKAEQASEKGSGARYGLFMTPRGGVQALIDALAAKLSAVNIHTGTPVERLERVENRWRIATGAGDPQEFDGLIVSVSAVQAGKLLAAIDHELGATLREIPYAGSAVVLLGYRQSQFARPIEGFGVVVPEVERREVLSISFSSQKYPDRAPPGCVLLRVFFGGAARPDQLTWADARLVDAARRELGDLLGVTGEPELVEVARWPHHMPQYHVGHLDRVATIERRAAEQPHLALCGSAYRGVGIPNCIHSAQQAAEQVCRGW